MGWLTVNHFYVVIFLADDQQSPPPGPSPVPPTEEEEEGAVPERRKKDKSHEGRLKDELKRQKELLDESRKRLEGMIRDGSDRKRVRDHLEEIQKELSKKVEKWSAKKHREPKGKGPKGKGHEQDKWKKEEKKKWKGEKDKKHSKGDEEWKGKEDKKKEQKENSHKEAWRKHQDEWERKKGERRRDREERRKEKPWHSRSGKNPHPEYPHHKQQHHQKDFWSDQEQKLRRNLRPLGCSSVEDCAQREGLYPVELQEMEELLEGYLSKLEGSSPESKEQMRKLVAQFFQDGVFVHDRLLFTDFAEDVADVLEDMVDVLEDGGKKKDDSLEEAMEEFEREALWKFAATP